MDRATKSCDKTISLLSQNYMDSDLARSEWLKAFSLDPVGKNRKIIPVRIDDFDIKGLLDPIVYIDLVECEKEEATKRLLDGASNGYNGIFSGKAT